ncbi:hypothetical protein NEMBOFW57_010609 [Staphylotrichum longicolle]|uniref:Uncharacterized protein n=1 Tax=Staphylotrichum longicolle TaxID=669026 RepID=A0AAD4ENE0_9PEZI|nr:hypothetical protein NEMBOFW57_010609 [Staphylotrichum longicolle]
MSSNPPPSISSTKVEAPQSVTGSLLNGKPPLLLNPDNSTSMLMRWTYDVHNVTVAEKLQRHALKKDVTSAAGK